MQRTLYFACGIGAVVFGGINIPTIVTQANDFVPWFLWVSLTFGALLPVSMAGLTWLLSMPQMKVLITVLAVGFAAVQAVWVFAMTVPMLSGGTAPWAQSIHALHATLASIAWRPRWAWTYIILQGPLVALPRYYASDAGVVTAGLDGIGNMTFCIILAGVVMALIAAANRQDAVADRAREVAAFEASERSREREQGRINAIVHDDIMSVLMSASAPKLNKGVRKQAERALQAIRALASDEHLDVPYRPQFAVTAWRTVVGDVSSNVAFHSQIDSDDEIPGEVVEVVGEALGEAVRNSVLHADKGRGDVSRSVYVRLDSDGASITVVDDGAGFNPRHVADRRLGLRVSILERMHLIPGGQAVVRSQPGQGTVVILEWSRQ